MYQLGHLLFQSTLPVGGATGRKRRRGKRRRISIHAPRGGSDPFFSGVNIAKSLFQSTLPVGGATSAGTSRRRMCSISIHAPRGGSDISRIPLCVMMTDFNPRSPWGERQHNREYQGLSGEFQSTLPVGGATRAYHHWQYWQGFQSTLPVGGATIRVFSLP